MNPRLLLIIAVAGFAIFAFQWFKRQNPAHQKKVRTQFIFVMGGLILIALVISGKLPWLFALLGAALPFAQRLFSLKRMITLWRGGTATHQGQGAVLQTRFIRVDLFPATGQMAGEILSGRHAGVSIATLTHQDLVDLWHHYLQIDPESAQVLAMYLDRNQGPHWRASQQNTAYTPTPQHTMTREEACAILGVDDHASEADIKTAHRKLMQKFHPDRGGSNYLAIKINQAKELLLKQSPHPRGK